MTDCDLQEDEIIAACALRFDGYRYADDTGFDLTRAVADAERTGDCADLSGPDRMATLFMIQRQIRWNGQCYLVPRDGPLYRAYRELFLLTAEQELPAEYRTGRSDGDFDWNPQVPRPWAECVALVRSIHEGTRYKQAEAGEV